MERYWPEPLVLAGRAGSPGDANGGPAVLVTNPAPVSRYVSGLAVRLDGRAVPADALSLVNPTPGETGIPIAATDLGPERGFYVRRLQTAEIRLPGRVAAGPHELEVVLGLAGVTETRFVETVDFR